MYCYFFNVLLFTQVHVSFGSPMSHLSFFYISLPVECSSLSLSVSYLCCLPMHVMSHFTNHSYLLWDSTVWISKKSCFTNIWLICNQNSKDRWRLRIQKRINIWLGMQVFTYHRQWDSLPAAHTEYNSSKFLQIEPIPLFWKAPKEFLNEFQTEHSNNMHNWVDVSTST